MNKMLHAFQAFEEKYRKEIKRTNQKSNYIANYTKLTSGTKEFRNLKKPTDGGSCWRSS